MIVLCKFREVITRNMAEHLLASLNQEQVRAVTHTAGSLLVLAGAGSGKTKVLTTRMVWLIQQSQLSVHELLAVTFTNKAAREMLQRVSKLLDVNTSAMWVGTFHALALRLLRLHYQEAGLSANFQIIDNADQLTLLKRLIRSKNLDEERYTPRELQKYINAQKEHCLRAAQISGEGLRGQHWLELYALYEASCQRDNLVDFTELLLRSYELLSMNQELKEKYCQQFKHILVDEFQDTNQLQYQWLQLLVGMDTTIFAVGDDDQSIYSFRGAKVSNMQAFMRDFAAPEPLRLEQNYRSTPVILAAANAIIDNNSQRMGKNLWTEKLTTDKIRLYEGYTEEDEAYFVIDEINNLRSKGIELAEMAILYRSNAQSRVFEQHLYQRGIAYRVYGGLRFFDRQEIKRVLAYLRLIINPDDNEALLRVINFPARGIGMKTVETLQQIAEQQQCSLYAASTHLSGKTRITLAKFTDLLKLLQAKAQSLSLAEIISSVIEESGMREFYRQVGREGEERLDNLNELITATADFISADQCNPVVEFLAHAVLESVDNQAQNFESAVQLMTVHAAKGLEFNVVFVVGLEDGLFPHDNSLQQQDSIEEERRLMYVAITRAREKLYLLRACSRSLWGKRLLAPISRFVNEIPTELILNLSGVSRIGASRIPEYLSTNSLPTGSLPTGSYQAETNSNSASERTALADKNLGFKIGDMVRHTKFGNGKILRLNADGKKITAEVFFIGLGKKTLDLNIAPLERILRG